MWELFEKYKEETKNNPILLEDYVGKDAEKVNRKKERPLTVDGFECWCYTNNIINSLGDYFSNKDGKYSDYSTICSRIRKTVRVDQIEGGMVGIYNPSITQRLNGLTEQVQNTIITEQPLFPE
jgi:hypothetical protein